MREENLVRSSVDNSQLASGEVQTFNLRGEKIVEETGESIPLTITISVQNETVQSIVVSCADDSIYEGELSLKLTRTSPSATISSGGDECECCRPGPTGMVCRTCPC